MKRRRWIGGRTPGLLIGGLVTSLLAGLYAGGMLDRLALYWLDVHFRHFNHIAASDRILMIDINDYAVERIHRWPWPRRLHAELVTALEEFGAAAVLMDIVFAEPMAPRFDHPALSPDMEVDPPGDVRGMVSFEDRIVDDQELADALRAAGNVYLAMFYQHRPPGIAPRPADSSPQPDALLPSSDAGQRKRIQRLLLDDFSLGRDALAKRLNLPPEQIEKHMAPAKRSAARKLVHTLLEANPKTTFAEVRAALLPHEPHERMSPDREDVLRAYRAMRALRAVTSSCPRVPATLKGRLERAINPTPPLDVLAESARAVAFVTFRPDTDGVVRRLPLVVDLDGFLVPQLGFALACDLLGVDLSSLGFDDGDLTLADADGRTYRVPLGPDGRSLLNWHLDRDHPQWRNSFEHLPVTRVMELVENRRIISQNQSRYALRMAQAVELVRGGPGAAYAEYEQAVRQLNRLTKQQASGLALSEQERQRLATEAGPLTERVAGMQADALAMLEQLGQQIKGLQPESPEEERVFAQVRSLSRDLLAGQLKRQIEADNAELAARNQELAADLRSHIQGKACFVGYTAAAVSDFVNTPVYKSAPGVLAHANMVNSLLQDRFVRLAPRWLNALLMVLAGLTMTLLAATRGPWVSLISVLLLISALLLASILLFVTKVTYVASAVAALTVFICWAFITLYRQLTEQQAKRQFSRALAQYTSPAVAAQIARQARVEDLAPRPREVTCFFSDLKGFTSISERLGAERTRELLNPYLEAMSQVLLEHRAMINKFMGDGIFAFFNPPIMECSDHAQRACAAAVDSMRALQGLKERFADITLGQDMAGLEMRVGIHTGDVFVGDYGSASKLDYTCIGDTVNLAARLEPANKAFGTCLMISQATQEQLDGRFVCRPLGKLQVVGKKQAVSVFELLGRSQDLNAEQVSYAEDFARAVALFQARQWDQAKAAFQHCQQARQADGAAKLYLRHIAAFQDHPPPDDWNQGIELTSK